MATLKLPARRLILAGGFVVAIAVAPGFAVFATPSPAPGMSAVAACTGGETLDIFTDACVPELAPGGGTVGAPSEQTLTACGGRDQSSCLEEQLYGGGAQVPNVDTTVQQSP
jgi:hypothetical protein